MKVKFLIHLILILNVNSDNLLDVSLIHIKDALNVKMIINTFMMESVIQKLKIVNFMKVKIFVIYVKKDMALIMMEIVSNVIMIIIIIHCIKEIDNCLIYPERSVVISESMRYFEGIKCTKCNEGYGLNEDSSACIKC